MALRRAKKGKLSTEVRARINTLLDRLEEQQSSHDHVRESRALESLELIGNMDARHALAGLAKGAPEARLTHGAKSALERIARR